MAYYFVTNDVNAYARTNESYFTPACILTEQAERHVILLRITEIISNQSETFLVKTVGQFEPQAG
jgi:hypothetical protein